ncbi:hypothetical protein Ctu_2p00100 (plasmid) [Cronobacter turicensis z3032]|uniref:Uncharacterized protein n=1 Tax=Cronobacter turicensis (strain DSM 18703 / CCUG 55852 / LMG 23827 / z3032) TaxID=693216 RepID=C9Y5N8_CROTZ|nr:hypothetical protein Ctu_2p00100 [Cronobacter turicensis z3032]
MAYHTNAISLFYRVREKVYPIPFFNKRPLKTGAVNAFYVKSLTLIR